MAMGTEANKGPRVVYALCPCYVLLIAKKRFLRVAEFAQGKHCRVPRRSFAATRAEIDSLARGARAPRWPTKTSAVSLPPRAASLGSLMPPLLRHPSVHAAHHAALLTRPHTAHLLSTWHPAARVAAHAASVASAHWHAASHAPIHPSAHWHTTSVASAHGHTSARAAAATISSHAAATHGHSATHASSHRHASAHAAAHPIVHGASRARSDAAHDGRAPKPGRSSHAAAAHAAAARAGLLGACHLRERGLGGRGRRRGRRLWTEREVVKVDHVRLVDHRPRVVRLGLGRGHRRCGRRRGRCGRGRRRAKAVAEA
mmetsp:Transcript_25471/g.55714  ORF Transcript_25471/g.55714 Transcript_25471/m.55714 type:complete len:315 (-) Transcript_25471:572-1516(-)